MHNILVLILTLLAVTALFFIIIYSQLLSKLVCYYIKQVEV